MRPHRGFVRALGKERVAWIGQGVPRNGLMDRLATSTPAVLGGPLTLPEVENLPKVSAIAVPLADPIKRCQNQWNAAVADENHPYHADAHTFRFREIFEEHLPFGEALANAAMHALAGTRDADPARVADRVMKGPLIVADPAFPKPFVREMAKVIGVPANAIDPEDFRAPQPMTPQGEVLEAVRRANRGDRALRSALSDHWHGQQRVLVTL